MNAPKGIVYYRVSVQDVDGSLKLSDVKTVDLKTASGISIYPNPADRELRIQTSQSFNNSVLRISNTVGQVVYSKRLSGNAPYSVDIAALPAGTYYVVVEDKNNQQRFSFVKR